MTAPIVLRDTEVAALLAISRSTLWNWDAQGLIPKPVRIGRTVRWREAEIHAWIAADCPNRATWEKQKTPQEST